MEQIIELNNLGVVCIEANKFKEAVHNLSCALELAKNHFFMDPLLSQNPCDSSTQQHHNAPLSSSSSSSSQSPSSRQDMTTTIMAAATDTYTGHHLRNVVQGQPFCYSSAIKYQHPFKLFPDILMLDPTTTQSSLTSSQFLMASTPTPMNAEVHAKRMNAISAIIIFNVALCFDMLASSSSTTRTRQNLWTSKAIALYEKVVELYLQSCTYSDVEDRRINPITMVLPSGYSGMSWRAQEDMVVMAAINNLVQLYQESSSSSSSRKEKFIALMMAVLQEVQQTEYGSEEIQILLTSQARVFASNAALASSSDCMTFWSPVAFSAAAA